MKFDKENNLHFVDVVTKTEDNFVQYATFYFTPEGKTKCFEPYAEYIDLAGDGETERHYYNRTNNIEDLKEIELVYSKDIYELDMNKDLSKIFDKAVNDAYYQSNKLNWTEVKDIKDDEKDVLEDYILPEKKNKKQKRKSFDIEL